MYPSRHSSHPGARIRRAGLLALSVLLVSCDDSPAAVQALSGSFVGRLTGSDAFVTVVTNGTDVRAYLCDGTANRELTISEWFRGDQSADRP